MIFFPFGFQDASTIGGSFGLLTLSIRAEQLRAFVEFFSAHINNNRRRGSWWPPTRRYPG
jgi:hypothetical protein